MSEIITGNAQINVGSKFGFIDLIPALASDGYLFKVKNLQLILSSENDTTVQAWQVAGLSIAPLSNLRTTFSAFTAPFFASDVIWQTMFQDNEKTMQNPIVNYAINPSILDNLQFADELIFSVQCRFFLSLSANVAGGGVPFAVRAEIERVKATSAMVDDLYRRLSS